MTYLDAFIALYQFGPFWAQLAWACVFLFVILSFATLAVGLYIEATADSRRRAAFRRRFRR